MAQLPAIVAGHGGSGTTTSITITAAASGNVLILFFSSFRSAGARTISSISTTNVTWARMGGTTVAAGLDGEIWAGVVSGGSSGTTVTITMSGTGSTTAARIDEYTGLALNGTAVVIDPIDPGASATFATATGATSPAQSVANLSPNTGDLLLACMAESLGTAPTVNPPAPWVANTFVNNSTTVGAQGNYVPNGSTDNQQVSWTLSSNVSWISVIGALKSAAGFQADFIKTRTRAYDSPDAELFPVSRGKSWLSFQQPLRSIQIPVLRTDYTLRIVESQRPRFRKTFIPDASRLGDNQLGFRPLNRLYESPIADVYPRTPFPSWLSTSVADQIPELRLFRSYVSPDADLGGRRGRWLPDNSSLGNDQTSHLKTSRLYLSPDADPGGRRGKWLPDNSGLGGDQTSHLKTFRLYVAPDADLGGRRSVWLPDNSGLGGDQIPWFRRIRLYESPTAEIYPSRAFSQATASVVDQLGWIRLNRLGVAALAVEVFAARTMLFSAAAEVPGIEEEKVRVGGFTGIQVPDIYVGGV